jgi:energy-coupling factor transport system substrate-specific component
MALGASRRLPDNASLTQAVMIVALCAALNVFGGLTARTLAIPIVYLDTVGTFIAAVLLGPWWGAAAGVTYNVTASLTFDPGTWPFALVSIVVALLWGYGIRRFGMGRSPITFFALGLVVAVVAAIVASPIVLFVYGGATGSAPDAITFAAQLAGYDKGPAVFLSNIESNLADKVLAGSIGLALVHALPATSLAGLRLPAQTRFGTLAMTTGGLAIGVALALVAIALPHG